MKNISKKITLSRIILSIALFFTEAFTIPFYIIYTYCGVSTFLDGYLAKKRKEETDEETKLDKLANLIFIVVAMIKILPELYLSQIIFIWLGFIVIIKVFNIILSFILYKKVKIPPSFLNKLTGILLFVTPLIVGNSDSDMIYIILCLIATAAALNETKLVKKEDEEKKAANTMTVQTYDFKKNSK